MPICVATDAFGGKDGIDRDLHGGNSGKAECFAPTDDVGIGRDRDDQRIGGLQARLVPHPASDRPPVVKGIRSGMDSILGIFKVTAFRLADAVGADRRWD